MKDLIVKELTIEELKEVELNILKDVAKFCEEHEAPSVIKVSFLGMMILISLCRERTTSGSSNYTMALTLVIMRTPWRIIRIGICPLVV